LSAGRCIALLGQPNSGKSTLFNALTGSRQHVGNWPGKTVERKTGTFSRDGRSFAVVDLPGSYSLYACSEEEVITRECIASGEADLVCIMVDASQLERSLFMLADYAGIRVPAILVLNMVDVAAGKGIAIDAGIVSERLGIPVVAMNATDPGDYGGFFEALGKPPRVPDATGLVSRCEAAIGGPFASVAALLPESGIGVYSRGWLASKLFERDRAAEEIVGRAVPPSDREKIAGSVEGVRDGALRTAGCKFEWIGDLTRGAVSGDGRGRPRLGRFDRLSLSWRWGKPLAVAMMLLGLIASFLVTIPWMMMSYKIPRAALPFLLDRLAAAGAGPWLLSIADAAMKAVGTSVGMAGFVAGSCLVFGFMEEIGYMARISYVFDDAMSRLGLQGKSVMPILMSFGCIIGGATGTRVIDSWGQRVLTMAVSWVVPCAATWGVVAVFGSAFFGLGTVWILAALFACSFLVAFAAARIFGGSLVKESERTGLIMELPPYHKPKWGSLFRFVSVRMGDMLKRALVFIVSISVLFRMLAYTADGNIENSVIYNAGRSIEPLTMWFGLRWQTFTAFVCSMMGKEAALGVLGSVFGASGESGADLGMQLRAGLSKPEALAFLFAFFFNIPCFIAVLSTRQECHSWTWTLRIAGFHLAVALLMSALAYHAGRLIF
jgi:ferrous iron transport protein B